MLFFSAVHAHKKMHVERVLVSCKMKVFHQHCRKICPWSCLVQAQIPPERRRCVASRWVQFGDKSATMHNHCARMTCRDANQLVLHRDLTIRAPLAG
jgi:hypothetical protein